MTNEDKLYQKLNEINFDTDAYDPVEISEDEKDILFNSLKKQVKPKEKNQITYKPLLITAAVLLLLFAGSQTPIGEKVQATANSIIENIRYSLSQALGNEETDSSEAALSFNQTARIGDAEISIQEMLAFDHRIVFNVLVNLDGPIEEEVFVGFSDFEMTVNDESLNTQGLSGRGEVYDKDENIHSVLYSTELTQDSLMEDEMTIEVMLQDIHYYNPSDLAENPEPLPPIEGEAHFSAETTREELTEHTEVYPIDHFVSTGEYDYHLEKLYVHPLLNYIEIYSENWGDENFQLIEIRGVDDQGRSVVFENTLSMVEKDYRRNSFTLSERKSEITTAQLTEAETIELQFYSAGWSEGGMAEYAPYGDMFRIEMKSAK